MSCRVALSVIPLLLSACGLSNTSDSVNAANSLPFAEAGQDKGVITGQGITLNASNSTDADGDTLSYHWAIHSAPDGSAAVLTQAVSLAPQLVPDMDGQYILSLVVNDGVSGSSIDIVTVTASENGNTPPVCTTVPNQGATTGNTYTLTDVTAVDVDDVPLSYQWALESMPDQSSTSLSLDSVRNPSFTPDTDGSYYLNLVVSDGVYDSQPCLVNIRASSFPNAVPVAFTGSVYGVYTGIQFTIDGSGTFDAEGDQLTYEWSVLNSPPGSISMITAPTDARTAISFDKDGFYTIKLTVSDGVSSSRPVLVLIKASASADIS